MVLDRSENNELERINDSVSILNIDSVLNNKCEDIKTVYHYTSIDGLKSILENQTLRISNAKYLNDNSELKYGLQLIKRCAKDIRERNDVKNEEVNNLFDEKVHSLILKIEEKAKNTYILSLSTNKDSLMLWSNYSGFSGYNLGIDLCKLKHRMKNLHIGNNGIEMTKYIGADGEKMYHTCDIHPLVYFLTVVYDLTEQEKMIYKYIEKLHCLCEKYIDKLSYKCSYDGYDSKLVSYIIDEIVESIAASLSYLILCFKQENFYPEEEIRAVVTLQSDFIRKDLVQYRVAKNMIIPFIEVKFNDDLRKNILPITAVTIGPTNNDEIIREGIYEFMKDNNYNMDNIEIRKSSIPLRF